MKEQPVVAISWLALILALTCGSLPAQCQLSWATTHGYPWAAGTVLPGGPDGSVYALTPYDPDGSGPAPLSVAVGGRFQNVGGVPANFIALFDPTSGGWAPLGSGMSGAASTTLVNALLAMPSGELIASGFFSSAGGTTATQMARWNGAAWSAMGSGPGGNAQALALLPNGDIVAGGAFLTSFFPQPTGTLVKRWDGSNWAPLGSGLAYSSLGDRVAALCVLPNGDLIAAGTFTISGGNSVARWNGTSWSPVGALSGVRALTVLPNGTLVAGGGFGVAAWNGGAWQALGTGLGGTSSFIGALAVLPNGLLVAAGFSPAIAHVAAWNGSTWTPLGGGATIGSWNGIQALASLPEGQLFVGGDTFQVNGIEGSFGQLTTPCPASATSFAVGCTPPTAAPALVATTLPFVGNTFRGRASGLPSAAIGVALTSLTAIAAGSLSLGSVLPQSQAGCDVLVQPDLLQAVPAANGEAASTLLLPNLVALIGTPLYHQMISLELGAGGAISTATASNSLRLVPGSF